MSQPLIRVIKEKETYVVFNETGAAGYYTVNKESCNVNELFIQGNIEANESFILEPDLDGTYIITINASVSSDESLDRESASESIIISHYPNLIASIVRDIRSVFWDSYGTGCPTINIAGCNTNSGIRCLLTQSLVENLNLLLFTFKSVNGCNNNQAIILNTIVSAFERFSCDFRELFCEKELDIKMKAKVAYNGRMMHKFIAICYYALYFYELEITNTQKEFVSFVDNKYNIKEIKNFILKTGIDKLEMEHLFAAAFFEGCAGEEGVCSFECFKPVNTPTLQEYVFDLNEKLNGIYHTVVLKNTCSTPQMFVNRVIYKDLTFKVFARIQGANTSVTIAPGEEITLNIIFEGTKSEYTLIKTTFNYEGLDVANYSILFREEVVIVNNPPVINDIYKAVTDSSPYTFTVEDFENSFNDVDGDTLDKVILAGDTTGFTLNGVPYQSGTIITRNNIINLKFTPPKVLADKVIILQWQAVDSRGATSE